MIQPTALLLAMLGAADPAPGVAIRAGNLFTARRKQPVIHNGVILISEGRILEVGSASEVSIPEGFESIDATDHWVVPGFVECHNHTAGSLSDLNDGVYGTNPGLRTEDLVAPDNPLIRQARTAGVSTLLLIPGSGNNISGFGTLVKSFGSTQDEVTIRAPGSLKIAQGDNPKRYWYRQERSFMNWSMRDTMRRARDYHEAWRAFESGQSDQRPRFNPALDGFRGLFDREFPVSIHTQRYQLVVKSIQMWHDEFDLWTVLDHSTMDGFPAAPLAVERNLDIIVGPRQLHFESKDRKVHGCAAEWWERGVTEVGINTDAPVIPEFELPYQATMAVHYGLPDLVALYALTIVPAHALGIQQRCGSLEPGKDADLSIWNGHPLDPTSRCERLYVNGKLAHDTGRLSTEVKVSVEEELRVLQN